MHYTTKRGANKMDPITFGMVFVGASGATLLGLAALGKKITINETAVKLTLEALKYGSILVLMHKIFNTFL
jgi:hypothetical protein